MRYIFISFVLILAGSLGGCGKEGPPTTPYNAPSPFPQIYPPLEKDGEDPDAPAPFPS